MKKEKCVCMCVFFIRLCVLVNVCVRACVRARAQVKLNILFKTATASDADNTCAFV